MDLDDLEYLIKELEKLEEELLDNIEKEKSSNKYVEDYERAMRGI